MAYFKKYIESDESNESNESGESGESGEFSESTKKKKELQKLNWGWGYDYDKISDADVFTESDSSESGFSDEEEYIKNTKTIDPYHKITFISCGKKTCGLNYRSGVGVHCVMCDHEYHGNAKNYTFDRKTYKVSQRFTSFIYCGGKSCGRFKGDTGFGKAHCILCSGRLPESDPEYFDQQVYLGLESYDPFVSNDDIDMRQKI